VYQDDDTEHEKEYTPEQRKAVMKVRNCRKKDYYGILGLDESCSERDIKKAYMKGSLETYPDKNKHPDAHKAFKS
jgi:DnaJ homolog subfamily B member 12